MKKTTLKKIVLVTGSVFLLLVAVLCIHIYIVTRPKAPDAHTLVMARIDIKQDINQDDANKITTWLYQQKGIDHVLCNPESRIAVFTFYPVINNGNAIVNKFKAETNYKADRYVLTEEDLKSGCPVATTSVSYKLYSYIKKVL